jgi:enoyl-CoA hydratase
VACDIIASSDTASFGQPETGLGFITGWGGSYRLPRRVGEARAKELIFTGKIIQAAEAYRLGLVNFVGTSEELEQYLASTLESIAKNSRIANAQAKQLLNNSLNTTLQMNCYEEAIASSVCLASGDTQQRLENFFRAREKR